MLCYSGNQHKEDFQIQYIINSNVHEVQTGILNFIVSDVSDIYFMYSVFVQSKVNAYRNIKRKKKMLIFKCLPLRYKHFRAVKKKKRRI